VDELNEQFLSIVTSEQMYVIYKAITKALYSAHLEYEVWEFPPEIARKSHGHLRNCFIDENLLQADLPGGMSIVIEHHPVNGYAQVVINIKDKVVMTVQGNDDPDALPEASEIRKKQAKLNRRFPLLELMGEAKQDEKINGLVTFQRGFVKEPSFISVVFPSPKFNGTTCDKVDLLSIGIEYEARMRADAEMRVMNQRKPINPEKKNVKLRKKA